MRALSLYTYLVAQSRQRGKSQDWTPYFLAINESVTVPQAKVFMAKLSHFTSHKYSISRPNTAEGAGGRAYVGVTIGIMVSIRLMASGHSNGGRLYWRRSDVYDL